MNAFLKAKTSEFTGSALLGIFLSILVLGGIVYMILAAGFILVTSFLYPELSVDLSLVNLLAVSALLFILRLVCN